MSTRITSSASKPSKRYMILHGPIDAGVFLAISGPSGSGKTTLLNLIGCIDKPTRGKVFINEEDVSEKIGKRTGRPEGTVYRLYFSDLQSAPCSYQPPKTSNTRCSAARTSPPKNVRSVVNYFLDIVGLSKFADHRPNQLSGGQRQRVAIARALAIKPSIVLADEPTANLDKATGREILTLMKQINRHLKTTFIFSTHDQKVIDRADRLVQMEDGYITAFGVRNEGEKIWNLARIRTLPEPDDE